MVHEICYYSKKTIWKQFLSVERSRITFWRYRQCIILNATWVQPVLPLTNLHISHARFMVWTHLQARKVKSVCSITHTLCVFSLISQENAVYVVFLPLSIHLSRPNYKPIWQKGKVSLTNNFLQISWESVTGQTRSKLMPCAEGKVVERV